MKEDVGSNNWGLQRAGEAGGRTELGGTRRAS